MSKNVLNFVEQREDVSPEDGVLDNSDFLLADMDMNWCDDQDYKGIVVNCTMLKDVL